MAAGAALALGGSGTGMAESTERNRGFLFGPGPAGRCDDAKVGIGVVRRDPAGEGWWMWYYCRDEAFNPDAPASLGSGYVAVARSSDGLDWRRIDGAGPKGSVLAPSDDPARFDSLHVGVSDVTWHQGQWWMWYFGGDHRVAQMWLGPLKGGRMRPGLAVSRDGLIWEKVEGQGPVGALIDHQRDIYAAWQNGFHDGTRWVMQTAFAIGDGADFQTRVTTSSDALDWSGPADMRWTEPPGPEAGSGIITRHVQRNFLAPQGAGWLMVYAAIDGRKDMNKRRTLWAATSPDGLVWTRLGDQPILEPGPPGAWDAGGVAGAQLVDAGKAGLRLYYYGFGRLADPSTRNRGVGLAVSADRTLDGLVKI